MRHRPESKVTLGLEDRGGCVPLGTQECLMPLRPPQRGTGGKTIKREKGGVDVTVGKKKNPSSFLRTVLKNAPSKIITRKSTEEI
jgi:hypothetical protein